MVSIKVLWLSINPALYRPSVFGNWSTALETALLQYHSADIQLAIAFESEHDEPFKALRDSVTYYPVRCVVPRGSRFRRHDYLAEKWAVLRLGLLAAIEDFRPDVIHCFGSEWLYGAIARDVSVPVVVHMQGFLNVYHEILTMVFPPPKPRWNPLRAAKAILRRLIRHSPVWSADGFEREVMRDNRYFMGRTEWDRNIVKYYSPGAKYFYAPEAIRPLIYEAAGTWQFRPQAKLRLLTVSSVFVDGRKGNEIILRAARLLKFMLGLDFEWRVTGEASEFAEAEKRSGLRHDQVNVNLIGTIDAPQLVSELMEATLFVHPSLIDNSPNAVCEAQLIGCPVVASIVGGVPQLVEHGQTGFLYPYNEPHTLAFLIGNIFADGPLLNQVSSNEVACATKRHNPKLIADNVSSVYRAVIDDYRNLR